MANIYSKSYLRCFTITSLIVACIAQFWCGGLFIFNVYSLALKHTFNYTQSDIDMMAALCHFGFHTAFPAGIVQDMFGPRVTSAMGLILTSTGYLLLWSTTKSIEFYTYKAGLLKLYFFIIGQGVTYTYMAAVTTTISNFTSERRVQALAILESFFGGGALVLTIIYASYFVNGHIYDEQNQNWSGFILILTIGSSIANCCCLAFLQIAPQSDANDGDDEDSDKDDNYIAAESEDEDDLKDIFAEVVDDSESTDLFHSGDDEMRDKTSIYKVIKQTWLDSKSIFTTRNFQIILWLKSIISPVGFLYLINITAILKSAKLEAYSGIFTILRPIAGILARVMIAVIAQLLKGKIKKSIILLITNMGFVVGQGLLISLGTNLTALHTANIVITMAHSCSFVLIVAILSDTLSKNKFGRMWGFILFVSTIFSFLYPAIFGLVYDAHTKIGHVYCYRLACTQLTFIFTSIFTCVALILNIALIMYTPSMT
ncbi:unnamed protein product [Owenia fusiformis]|uniref:Uncharacterized protein n=1 Tax=Owenia fusiformis TaxID=6347 RepID=A0A8J1T7B4_OWEFU|nr:unnamed protein product [Owenia fusiformis]